MPDDPEMMDEAAAIRSLNDALRMQYRSALQYMLAAASIGGLEYVGLAERLWKYAEADFADLRRIAEKIVALGGTPTNEVEPPQFATDAQKAVRAIVTGEREAIAALHAVIPHTGQEPRSEALEHLMEHLILRKQEQLDQILRAIGETE
jgi:bacterioferritin (cytochrome b1)